MDHPKSINKDFSDRPENTLNRKELIKRLKDGLLGSLDNHFEKLVPAQPWIVYWISHSLALLDQQQFLDLISADVIKFIAECAHTQGGYGGGAGQIAHLGTTFAAVNAIITITNESALESIDRSNLLRYLHRMKQPDGSFSMHDGGEVDSRATYCALSILRCLNIQDSFLLENVGEWILSCQTYEGGFGSVPGSEAHGGYTFCCVASLCLINQLHRADLNSLLRWLVNKQTPDHGGFCGRSNKLVDSCYSYWQGSIFPILYQQISGKIIESRDMTCHSKSYDKIYIQSKIGSRIRSSTSKDKDRMITTSNLMDSWLMDCTALQDYILNQCQSRCGLLRDKPGAEPDFYHTCYALSGLSISQHQPDDSLFDIGSQQINHLKPTQPLFNLSSPSLDLCLNYFCNKKIQTFDKQLLEKSRNF